MSSAGSEPAARRRPWLRFDRGELGGAFGDIGTDLPLLVAMIPAAGLDAAPTLLLFGLAQIIAGLVFGLPMPMQPLKAMAVLVITERLSGGVLYGGGLVVGAVMLLLAVTGLLDWLVRVIPRPAVRGIQLGLAIKLGHLALGRYVPSMGLQGYLLAAACFVCIAALVGNRRLPPALPVVGLGVVAALIMGIDTHAIGANVGVHLPTPHLPTMSEIAVGAVALALPQLPLSISNSVIATHAALGDLFPERSVSVRKIGLSYALVNLALPFAGGMPVCHGCGGLAGHHAFGARTGGSVVIYGAIFLTIGLLFGPAATEVVRLFPAPMLGVILLFEAMALGALVRDVASEKRDLSIALLVGFIAGGLPQGFVIGLAVGTALYYAPIGLGTAARRRAAKRPAAE